MENESEILFRELPGEGGNIGIATLNRPKALNALTHPMCLELNAMLAMWAVNPQIKAVVIYGIGDKAFSAGGDIRHLYERGKASDYAATTAFFHDEYRLNYAIHQYPKPYIALLDGVTMGGGVGLSIHGSHRIVTERFLFAMPETGIGFFPDIGASYFLSRCPGFIGTYLGLTGERLDATEALHVELADYFIFSNHLSSLVDQLAQTRFSDDPFQTVSHVCESFISPTKASQLALYREFIDTCFDKNDIENIILALHNTKQQWHQETLATLLKKSPTSLKVTLQSLRLGATQDIASCLQMEFRIAQQFMHGHDFYEGVRAVLIDKDYCPYWKPDRLNDISNETVNAYFSTIEKAALSL